MGTGKDPVSVQQNKACHILESRLEAVISAYHPATNVKYPVNKDREHGQFTHTHPVSKFQVWRMLSSFKDI